MIILWKKETGNRCTVKACTLKSVRVFDGYLNIKKQTTMDKLELLEAEIFIGGCSNMILTSKILK